MKYVDSPRSAVFALLSVIAILSLATASAVAAPSDGRANVTGDDGPTVTTSVDRIEGTGMLRYELTLTGLSEYERVKLVVGRDATVVAADGVVATDRSGRTWLQSTGQGDEAVVHIRTSTAASDHATNGGEFFAADAWLLGRVPLVEVRWARAGERFDRRRLLENVRGQSIRVTAGERYALVGDQRDVTVTTGDGEIRIVRPRGTQLEPSEDALASALGDAADRLEVGDRGDEVLLFALGGPVRRGGESFPVHDEYWVNANSNLDDPNNVWLHEYVHTRQDFVLADDMRWFREASAEYYAARLAYEQGRIDRSAMQTHLDGDARRATLTAPASWDDPHVPYTKGARVLALVDRKIKLSTDGERSLEDVFRRLNAHEGAVTYDDFTDAVAVVAGHRMDGWLDRYVDGSEAVAGFYPGGPEQAGSFDPLWSLLADAGPGAVFLGVSVVLSGLGSVPLYRYLDRNDSDGREERPGWPV